eukprot:TRINITY_DN171_c0_g2_i1.p1 TRINITY_DN171_c0_g2~~TRINITY_DN171_c0_g2_i1.p1  ORF type:complete len:185 (+),score=25.35 TRINITY_DN171_c0_g2_i1:216-770(+)
MSKRLFVICVVVLFGFCIGAEEVGVPFCECVNATVNCTDGDTLDGLVQTFSDISVDCLNSKECSDECQIAFYPFHAYHELCPDFGAEAGELYHDLALSCTVCDPGHIGTSIDRPECPEVDCSDTDDQEALTAFLTSAQCQTNCFTNSGCVDAWTKLSSYHETCPEKILSPDLTKEYHEIGRAHV